MKHKTWFRLLIKAIGVALMAYSAGHVIHMLVMIGLVVLAASPFGSMEWMIAYGVGHVAAFLIGLYLFLSGQWIINLAIPSNRPYCPECGYDLTHNTGPKCTECGVTLPDQPAPPRDGDS